MELELKRGDAGEVFELPRELASERERQLLKQIVRFSSTLCNGLRMATGPGVGAVMAAR